MLSIYAQKSDDGSVILLDFNTKEKVATYPSHLSNKPTKRNKYVMFNCYRYNLVWV